MIVPMAKMFLVARRGDRDRLLEALRDLGVIHLSPLEPAKAVLDEKTVTGIRDVERALQVLGALQPAGQAPGLEPADAVHEVLDIQRRTAERQSRLAALERLLESVAIWGDVRVEQFEALRQAGLNVCFFAVPEDLVDEIQAECVQPVGSISGRRTLVAAIDRRREVHVPKAAQPVPLPSRDAPSIRAEAAEIQAAMKADAQRLAELAGLCPAIENHLTELRQQADYTRALRGAMTDDHLFALQGWMPAGAAPSLQGDLARAGLAAAVKMAEPGPDENPPTLIRYPAFARPIEGLFKVLGTVAGYREFDVSAPFMIALPIFAALLIGDGGYGLVLLVALSIFYRKASKTLGVQFTRLLLVVGATSLAWGFVCATFFGVSLYKPLIPVDLTDESRSLMMKISFIMGVVHLTVAQLWQALRFFPDQRFLGKVGWATFIWGVFGVVGFFVLNQPVGQVTYGLLIAGVALIVLFSEPVPNVVKRLLLGLAGFPLGALSAFSDVISYVRLMAVGLASGVLASSFNDLALGVGFLPLTIAVLLFGHGLNLGLAMIALFAHGVRLNMLEFSNNLGMQWTGYPYSPFVKQAIQEN